MTGRAGELALRISALEAAHPSVMVWPPEASISGKWEALHGSPGADEWLLKDQSPGRFYARLERKLGAQAGPAASPAGHGGGRELVCALCHRLLSQCTCVR